MTDTALARRPDSQELKKAANTQLTVSSAILDRDNLQFFANMIEAADLIPKGNGESLQVRKSRVMAKICGGVPHGFDPISSQQNLDIIDGRIVLNARGIEVKIARTGRYSTRIESLDDKGCKLTVLEKNAEGKWLAIGTVEFTEDMAKKAGLADRAMYKKYGPDMYFARAITRVAKRFVPEALDTSAVAYDLAKREPVEEKQPEQIAETPEVEAVQPEAKEYIDNEYSGPTDFVDSTIHTEPPDTDEPEITPLERLQANVSALLDELEPRLRKDIIAGKPLVADMSEDELNALLAELQK